MERKPIQKKNAGSQKTAERIDGVIFDLDGTLWDASETVAALYQQVLEEYPQIRMRMTGDLMRANMGKPLDEITRGLLGELPLPDSVIGSVLETYRSREREYVARHGGVLYPGLKKALERLREKRTLYIVSNCQLGYIDAFLEYSGLSPFFQDSENAARTGLSKGENILLVMKRNGLQNPVYVGDTQGDLEASRLAGIPFIWAEYGFGSPQNPSWKIQALDMLPCLLEKMEEEPLGFLETESVKPVDGDAAGSNGEVKKWIDGNMEK